MKFLQAAVLSVICVGYVTASHPGYLGYLGLYRAIDEGRLDIAVDLGKQNGTLGELGVEYVIARHNPDLIASFVNQTDQANAHTLSELWNKRSNEVFEKVIEKVDFPQQALVDLASSYGVAYYPETFLVLLNKIVKPEDQEKVVEKGIEKLVHESYKPSRLLNALKDKTFRSERLEYIAIQKAFTEGVKRNEVGLVTTDICEHAAITPELYADALTVTTAEWEKYGYMRQFLLTRASRYDLEAVKEKAGYAGLNPEFRDAIEKALKTAAPGGTRTRTYDIQTVEKAEETFKELRHDGISAEIADLISAYVTVYAPNRREDQTASKKAAKKVASDVTSTPTTKTESSTIRKRKRGKGRGGRGKGRSKEEEGKEKGKKKGRK